MKILAIDTTTDFLCLGIYGDSKVYEYNLESGRRHSALLVPTIQRVLEALSWKVADIDYFACGIGPGSFTGVRIGLATVKGFAWAIKKPVIGISTLDLLAMNAKHTPADYIMPLIDAKRNLVYCSIYKMQNHRLKRLAPYMLLSEKELLQKIKPNTVLLGDGLSLYQTGILKRKSNVETKEKDYWYPLAGHLIALSLEKIKAKKFSDCFKIKPIYLYPKECQICASTGQPGQR